MGGALPAGLRLLARGRVFGTPTRAGTQAVTMRVFDGKGGFSEAQISFKVVDNAPVPSASDVRGAATAGQTLVLNLSATDPLGGGLSYRITQQPRGLGRTGAASLTRRGSQWMLVYRSSVSFSGTDIIRFVAIARDGARSAPATARIRVQTASSASSARANGAFAPPGETASDGSAARS